MARERIRHRKVEISIIADESFEMFIFDSYYKFKRRGK